MKTSEISVGNNDYDLAVHVTTPVSAKTPVLVYLTQRGQGKIGSYVYTIGRGTETYSSILQQGEDAGVDDLATNLGRVILKRFGCPSYVCMSGCFMPYEYGELSRQVVAACNEAVA
ncbi:hypothetical protein METBIDRAFT_143617 [Metschnikowia bicuspidata var. bicuspidata NRRL YB-4993]|uniref:Proteasome assembly chaperone 3 n=1 Tax=Metschnikowia bicuspidata var. bicuspidata NRRL YB-4993 TaxID=869754 RepID=A0A1A0HDL0_9ASCO|nr:hypothetical protein METBIDRAFT_143617 [Metschnikowia bicuspidata var. bicuspidata NRRL YB-4993]OBA21982.1 hypothetical protein METBIDRAFT_143617 [Metschnikowia bicuspidata var. bicuspidata NRRL YB-4993]